MASPRMQTLNGSREISRLRTAGLEPSLRIAGLLLRWSRRSQVVQRPARQGPRHSPDLLAVQATLRWNRSSRWRATLDYMTGSPHAAIAKGDFEGVPREMLMPEIPVSKSASGPVMPSWWIKSELLNLPSRALHSVAPTPLSLRVSRCQPSVLAHILKAGGCQAPASPLPAVLAFLRLLVLSEHPESFFCSSWMNLSAFLDVIALPRLLPWAVLQCCFLFVSSPWPHWAFFKGKSCVFFLACTGLVQARLFGCPGVR